MWDGMADKDILTIVGFITVILIGMAIRFEFNQRWK